MGKGSVVGRLVSVLVGVNNSAPIEVTVGVNVIGVGVAVAKRFCVGWVFRWESGSASRSAGWESASASNPAQPRDPSSQPGRHCDQQKLEMSFLHNATFCVLVAAWLKGENLAMRQRDIRPGNDRASQHALGGCGCHQLVLEPGILIIAIALDLAQVEIIKISALIVVAEDRAASPGRAAPLYLSCRRYHNVT